MGDKIAAAGNGDLKIWAFFQLKLHRSAKTLSPLCLCKGAITKVSWFIQVRLEHHNKSVTKIVALIDIDQR
jgi:hypothetical protein